MTTTIFLIRHAAHDLLGRRLVGRMSGVYLSPAGQAQATQLAERMAAEAIDVIYSSPQPRALQTAAPLAARLQRDVQSCDGLDEIDFGRWTGMSFADLAGDPLWPEWNSARSTARAPGGESMAEAQRRIAGEVERVQREHPGTAVVFTSHGDVIKAAVAHCLGLSLDGLHRFEVEPASITTLVVGDWGMKLLALNERCGGAGGGAAA